jgi:hypothetical protein
LDDHDQRRVAERDDRREIAERIERQGRIGDRHEAVRGRIGKDGVAVRLGTRDRRHGDGIARAGAIFDHDRLAEPGRDLLHHGTRHDIECASSALRDEHVDIPGRPSWCGLRECEVGSEGRQDKRQKKATAQHFPSMPRQRQDNT